MSRAWEQFCSRFAAELEAAAPWPDALRLALETSPGIPRPVAVLHQPADLAAWLNHATVPAWPLSLLADAIEVAPDQPQLWAIAARRVVVLLDTQDELADDWRRQVRPVRRSAWLWLGGAPALAVYGAFNNWPVLTSGLGPNASPIVAILAGGLAVGAAVWWWILLAEADRKSPLKSLRTVARNHAAPSAPRTSVADRATV